MDNKPYIEKLKKDNQIPVKLKKVKLKMDLDYGIKVYPNPVSQFMSLQIANIESVDVITLSHLSGMQVMDLKDKLTEKSVKVDVGHIHTGMYILIVVFADGHKESTKVRVQN